MKEIGEVVQFIPQERISERIVEVVQINRHRSATNSAPLNNK